MKTQELKLVTTAEQKHSNPGSYGNFGGEINMLAKRYKWVMPFMFLAILYACNNSNQLVQQYKALHEHDSLLRVQTQADDSTIKGYIHNMNEIQSNLDEIKSREKVLTVHNGNESNSGNSAVADIKAIDDLIIKSNREVAALHLKVKNMNVKNAEMETMIDNMTAQIAEKDTEIAVLQSSLANVNNSYSEITRQFNDSMSVLQNQNARVENLVNSINTVYYAIGTEKELKNNKLITKSGGFIGIGKNTQLTPDNNTSYFTKTDMTKLSVIPLNAKFKKLLTTHPAESYKIEGDKRADSLVITDQTAFWSENKYLVIAVK